MKTYQIIVALLVSIFFGMTAVWADTEGKCGDNVFWRFCTSDSTLTLSGSGATYNYGFGSCPWPNNVYTSDPTHPNIHWSDSIKYIVIEDGITTIGNNMFLNLIHLKTVSLPQTLKIIGEDAFSTCWELTEINWPEQLQEIGKGAFNKCYPLHNGLFPSSLKKIGELAFSYCQLTKVFFPAATQEIDYMAFLNCSISEIVVENGNQKYDSRRNCNALIETATNTLLAGSAITTIPSSVTRIGYGAFSARKIVSIDIPSRVQTIDKYAFFLCDKLKFLHIPASVESLGSNAISNCSSLEYLKVDLETPLAVDRTTFYKTPLRTLVVPENSVDAYKNADIWKNFEHIVTATDIKGALINDDSIKEIYRLDGTKVSGEQESLVPGTYIVQGEKILIK